MQLNCFIIIMFLGIGQFEFGYDLLRHSAYCIVLETVIEASKKFNKYEILSRIIPKIDSDLKDYFTIEGTKVKIKAIQYSAISIALVFLY